MKQFSSILLMLSVVLFLTGCGKEKIEDISTLFKNTEWTGEIKYNNKPVSEPFSIEFSENGTFKWRELSGAYDGTYAINSPVREIKLHLTASNALITATVTQDNKFTNISSLPDIYNCEINNSGTQNLNNTTWKGKYSNGSLLELYFKPGQIVFSGLYDSPYERAGVTLRIASLFSVIQPDSKTIKGIYQDPLGFLSFEIRKQ